MPIISYVKDNDPKGPERVIVSVKPAQRPLGIPELDGEPFTQFVTLKCGHSCYNTYGNHIEEKFVGQIMKCYLCGQKDKDGRL